MKVAYESTRFSLPASFGSAGVGETLGIIVNDFKAISNNYLLTISGQRFNPVRRALSDILEECGEDNWDGYGARPITSQAYFEALRFIDLLPDDLPLPDVVPEPRGQIGFEWRREHGSIYVIALNGKNLISYTGLFGAGNEAHGTENFTEFMPETIIEHFNRLYLVNARKRR